MSVRHFGESRINAWWAFATLAKGVFPPGEHSPFWRSLTWTERAFAILGKDDFHFMFRSRCDCQFCLSGRSQSLRREILHLAEIRSHCERRFYAEWTFATTAKGDFTFGERSQPLRLPFLAWRTFAVIAKADFCFVFRSRCEMCLLQFFYIFARCFFTFCRYAVVVK